MSTKMEKIMERFVQSDLGRRMLEEADQEEANVEKRAKTVAELAVLKKDRPAVMARITAENAAAQKQVDAAWTAYEKAKLDFRRISGETYARQWQHDQAILLAESYLMRSAPGDLRDALRAAEERATRLREKSIEKVSWPDIPEAVGMREEERPTGTPIAERASELAVIGREIEAIKERILKGE